MILVTRLNGSPMILNSDLIKIAEASPDTMLTLIHGEKLIVRESCEQVMERVVAYRAMLLSKVAAEDKSPHNTESLVTLAALPMSNSIPPPEDPAGSGYSGDSGDSDDSDEFDDLDDSLNRNHLYISSTAPLSRATYELSGPVREPSRLKENAPRENAPRENTASFLAPASLRAPTSLAAQSSPGKLDPGKLDYVAWLGACFQAARLPSTSPNPTPNPLPHPAMLAR